MSVFPESLMKYSKKSTLPKARNKAMQTKIHLLILGELDVFFFFKKSFYPAYKRLL